MAQSKAPTRLTVSEAKNQAAEKGAHQKQQQTKLLTLVGLAFLILVLGWVGTMKWNYATANNARAGTLFERLGGAAVEPGAEKLKEGSNALKSQ